MARVVQVARVDLLDHCMPVDRVFQGDRVDLVDHVAPEDSSSFGDGNRHFQLAWQRNTRASQAVQANLEYPALLRDPASPARQAPLAALEHREDLDHPSYHAPQETQVVLALPLGQEAQPVHAKVSPLFHPFDQEIPQSQEHRDCLVPPSGQDIQESHLSHLCQVHQVAQECRGLLSHPLCLSPSTAFGGPILVA